MTNLFNKAIDQAKKELKARYLTEKVAMKAMEIYLQLKRSENKGA